jgi:hypothetical protein
MQKLQALIGRARRHHRIVEVDRSRCCRRRRHGGDATRGAVRLVEELKGAIGVDLPKLLRVSRLARAPPG